MSFLTAAQDAARLLISSKPTVFFTSTEPFEAEICALANDIVRDLISTHEWRRLTKLQTYTGDGTTTAFDLPTDFDRITMKGEVRSTVWRRAPWTAIRDVDKWDMLLIYGTTISPGYWIMLGGQMHFHPAPGASDEPRWYYISRNAVQNESGADKPLFTSDDDTFKLDERLLTLALVWRFKELKRLAYDDDLQIYQKALGEAMAADKGGRLVPLTRSDFPNRFGVSYPWPLG